jgi:GNAT superfamily N-acetyltransferase
MKQETLDIRPARPADAEAVAQVHVASWRHAYRGLIPDDYLDRLSVEDREAMWRGAFADPDPRSGAFVAEQDGRVVGFAAFGPSRDDDAREGTGEVPAIYLDPAVVGSGIGRALFAEANAALREVGFTSATLWVLEANAPARRFYEKAGWTWDGGLSTHMFDRANEPVVRYATEL